MKKWILGIGLCVCVVLIGCGGAKKHYKIGVDHYQAKDYIQAFRFFTKACEGGSAHGCGNAGVMYYFGNAGVKKDFIKARSYYAKGCELNDTQSCHNLGAMYANGEGGAKDEIKALDMLEKACGLDFGNGCQNAGFWYADRQQYDKARKPYEKGCELGGAKACYNLAALYHDGVGARQNFKKAKEFAGKACDLGYQDGCEAYKQLKNAGY